MKWLAGVSLIGCVLLLGIIGWMIRGQSRYHPPGPVPAAVPAVTPVTYAPRSQPVAERGAAQRPSPRTMQRPKPQPAPERIRPRANAEAAMAEETEYIPTVRAPISSDEYAAPEAPADGTYEEVAPAAEESYAEPAPSAQEATVDTQTGDTVHITNSGRKYHKAGCRHLAKSDTPMSRSEAEKQGYTPCSVCKP